MLKSLRSEDWVSTLIGIVIMSMVVLVTSVMNSTLYMSLIVEILAYLGYILMGNKDRGKLLI